VSSSEEASVVPEADFTLLEKCTLRLAGGINPEGLPMLTNLRKADCQFRAQFQSADAVIDS